MYVTLINTEFWYFALYWTAS